MYQRSDGRGYFKDTFVAELEAFINFLTCEPSSINDIIIKYPSTKCKNNTYWDAKNIKLHLSKNKIFVQNY